MGIGYNPLASTNGLILCLDAGNIKSYSGSGTSWNDLSGNNNANLINGATYNVLNGGSIFFDGIDDYVSFNSNPQVADQITIETWVKLEDPPGTAFNGWLFGREGSYRMLYAPNSFQWVCATENNGWYTTGTSISAGSVTPHTNIYQVVGTYDGSNNKIYVNGKLNNTGASISGNIRNSGTYNLMNDASSDPNIDLGKGNIFVHKIYNRALTDTEIEQNFNALRGRFGI